MVLKTKEKSKNVDSRLKISGMTEKYYKGALPPHNPLRRRKHKKRKDKRKRS